MPFYFFFGLLGLVAGGLITWFFIAEHPFESLETPGGPVDSVEVSLLAEEMEADGLPMDEATIVKLLELHGAYVDGRNRAAQEAAEADLLASDAAAQQAAEAERAAEAEGAAEAERAAAAGRKAPGAEQTK